jgi:ribosomal protein S20
VKAHRQTIKRTTHNRELRSRLRTALKAIAGDRCRQHG